MITFRPDAKFRRRVLGGMEAQRRGFLGFVRSGACVNDVLEDRVHHRRSPAQGTASDCGMLRFRKRAVSRYGGGVGAGISDAKVYRNVDLLGGTKTMRSCRRSTILLSFFLFLLVRSHTATRLRRVGRGWRYPHVIIERHGTPRMLRFNYLIRNRERVTSEEFYGVLAVRLRGWVA